MGRSVLRLLEPTGGQVIFNGVDYTALKDKELRDSRKELQIIFQDPYASLDPRMTIGDIIAEPLDIQLKLPAKERMQRVLETMERAGLNTRFVNRYPHEFSGGQRRRIGLPGRFFKSEDRGL
ncbi:MAG: ATP-binding cassette domain-containing protein [Frisingicoccus sp.]